MSSFLVGARVRSTVTFTPESGHTSLADVTARVINSVGDETSLTVAAGDTDVYTADIAIPDDATPGPWTVRWESASPKIVVETSFTVTESAFLHP